MQAEQKVAHAPAPDDKAASSPSASAPSGKNISTIQFPYGDLSDAVEFAQAVHAVGSPCTVDQVAAYLKQSPHSGAFRLRCSYPRIFGLTESQRGVGGIKLTPLGMRIVDATQEAAARADAFLHVALYKSIFEKYKGYTLPPPAALEREMAALGVSPKQTDKARQAFDRSARQAGFTWAGADRLVMPVTKNTPESRPLDHGTPGADAREPKKGGGGGEPPDRTELMSMLLRFLPEGDLDNDKLARWLRAAEINLRMAYDTPGSIKIEVVDADA